MTGPGLTVPITRIHRDRFGSTWHVLREGSGKALCGFRILDPVAAEMSADGSAFVIPATGRALPQAERLCRSCVKAAV